MPDLLLPGQTGFARFVGEFEIGPGEHIPFELTPNVGDVAQVYVTTEALGRTSYLQIRCAICGEPTLLPLEKYRGDNPCWKLTNRDPVNVEPSIREEHYRGAEISSVCHFFVHAGRFEALTDSILRKENACD